MAYNTLTAEESAVMLAGNTEPPFTGEYDDFYREGTFICRRCNAPLFSSKAKFDAGCGWPAFDSNLAGSIKRIPDPDGQREEIRCAHCDSHLGHVFRGERFTPSDTRHCVNSLSIRFIPSGTPLPEILHADIL